MRTPFFQEHWSDNDGNPEGGTASGRGWVISWQRGPLGKIGTPERREPNGAFVEDIIQAVIGRLEFYQASRFACQANADALTALALAAEVLDKRTQEREARSVEGTHAV
jgi:hypothetical protein